MVNNYKYVITAFVLFAVSVAANAQTTFYYDGSGNLNNTSNWGTNTNGSGTSPANFTTANQIFQIRNTTSVSSNNNWTVSGTNSKVVIGNASVAAITVTHSGGDWNATVDIAAASSGTNTLDLAQSNGNTPTLGTLNSTSTVTYTRGGTQTVQGVTYGNLTIGGSSGTKTAGAAVVVNGTLTINTSRIFSMSTFALSGTLTPAGTGELQTANTSSTPIPADEVWTGTVTYNSASGQTIVSGTYPTLTASGGTRTFSSSGTIIISGTFTPGVSNYSIGTSTVRYTTSTANLPVPSVASGGNYYNLEIASGTWAMPSAMTVGNNLTVSGGTFNVNNASSNALTVNGSVSITAGTLDLNIGASGTSTLNVKGNFSVSGTGATNTSGSGALNGTINFNGSGTLVSPQTLSYTTPTNNVYVNFSVASGTVVQMNSNIGLSIWTSATYYGTMTVNSGGTLNMQSYSFVDETSFSATGNNTVVVNSGATVVTSHDSGIPGNMSSANTIRSLSSGANYEFRGALTGAFTTTPTANTVNNFTVNNASGVMLSQAFTIAGTLTFSAGALLLNGTTLGINGSISGTSSFTGSATSSITVAGSGSIGSNLNMTSTSSDTRTLQNFTVNRSSQTITLGAVMEVTGTVTVTAGTLASAGNLTLISTASSDASIANSAGSVTGNVIVQKYIPAGSSRRWIHVASPVSGFTWNQLYDDIYISGQPANGFDNNGSFYPSAYTYDESVSGDCGPNGWQYPASVGSSVGTGKGLKLFFRGDRSDPARLNYSGAPSPNATTIDFTGTINSGTQNLNVTYTNNGNSTWDGWNFVANPYPSAIDWNAASGWTKTNISSTIYVWNAQTGVYATWNGSSGTNGMSNGRIAMGQGFWVKATASGPTLSMTEAVKTTSSATGFFKGNASGPVNAFRVSMVQDTLVRDELLFNFGQDFHRSYDKSSGDALKLYNTSINIWAKSSDGQDLVINNYPSQVTTDTITLGMTSSTGGVYTLEFSTDSLPQTLSVYLVDAYRNKTIDVRKEKSWKVLINTDAASYATGRLKLIFINNISSTLLNLEAESSDNKTAAIQWTSNQELNTQRYEVEHSSDGQNYSTVNIKNIADSFVQSASSYSIIHQTPVTGINYYRVKRVTTTGAEQYTNTAEVTIEAPVNTGIDHATQNDISVYPNPAMAEVKVTLPQTVKDEVQMELFNLNGSSIYLQTLATRSSTGIVLDLSGLPAGVYVLKASGFQFLATQKIIKR